MAKKKKQADARQYISSKWLKSIHIEDDAPVEVTIESISVGKYKDTDTDEHLFMMFEEYEKPYGCANAVIEFMCENFGVDFTEWEGETIVLTVEKLETGQQAIRARAPTKQKRRAKKSA